MNQFYQQVGTDKLSIRSFLSEHRLVDEHRIQRAAHQESSLYQRYLRPMFKSPDPVLRVHPREDAFFRMAVCCRPLPGDDIVGVQEEEGITIHRAECSTLERAEADSLLRVGWEAEREPHPRSLEIQLVQDQPGLLYKVSKVMRDCKVNIIDLGLIREDRTGQANIRVDLEPIPLKVFRTVIARLRGIKEVEKITLLSRSLEKSDPLASQSSSGD